MARQLKLTRSGLALVEYQWAGAFRMRIDASDPNATGADPAVFLYRQDPINPYTNTASAVFFAVASIADIAEYPVGEPNEALAFPFFRLDYIELDFRTTSQALEVWQIIISEVASLLAALDRMDELVELDIAYVGTAPTEGVSESVSSSESE